MSDPVGIYIHIPFCVKKCRYCDFCSFPALDSASRYTDALISDIRRHDSIHADTLYIGGGTPTHLPSELLTRIIQVTEEAFGLDESSEISVECNPGTADAEYFYKLKNCGVNRLSIGMQSALDHELSLLGRIHSFEQTKKAVRDAKAAGFENINLDLMYGIPDQTKGSFEYSLRAALALKPTHISAYALKLEEGTELLERQNEFTFPNEDEVCDMLDIACEMLSKNGLQRYEISNFAIPGAECKHNMKYWRCEPYLSFGASAASYFNGVRYTFNRSINGYIAYANGEADIRSVLSEYTNVTSDTEEYEYIMLGLRLTEGISDIDFKKKFGIGFGEKYGDKFDKYIRLGLAERNDGRFLLNKNGMLVSNAILSELI